MMLSDWRVLLRRWYITIVGLLATAGLCVAAMIAVPASHQLTAQVMMVPPRGATKEVSNPYLALGDLEPIADVLARSMTDQQATEAIKKAGGMGDYTIVQDLSLSAPVLLITVTSPTSANARQTMQMLLDKLPQTLVAIQQRINVATKSFISSKPITEDTEDTLIRKTQVRAVVVAGAVGGVGTYLLAALLDGLVMRRNPEYREAIEAKRRQRAVAAAPPVPFAPPAVQPVLRHAPAGKAAAKPAGRPAKPVPAKAASAAVAPARANGKAARPAAKTKGNAQPAGANATAAKPAGAELADLLTGLLEPGDLEVPAGDARFSEDLAQLTDEQVQAATNGAQQRNLKEPEAYEVTGPPDDTHLDSDLDSEEFEHETAGEHGSTEPPARNLVPSPANASRRSLLDEDADLPGAGGEHGTAASLRILMHSRPRHTRSMPPQQ